MQVVRVLRMSLDLAFVLAYNQEDQLSSGTQTATFFHPQLSSLIRTMKFSRSRTLSVCTSLMLATSASAASLTAVGVYDDDSCSGAPLQVVFSPTATDCSSLRPDSGCALEAKDMGLFATGNCTNDPRAFSAATFGDSPYVFVELYTPDTDCESLEGVAAYRIDSACHRTVDAGTSFQVDWDDLSPSFQLFADGSCSSTPMLQFDLAVDSNECHGGSMKLHVMNADESGSS